MERETREISHPQLPQTGVFRPAYGLRGHEEGKKESRKEGRWEAEEGGLRGG